MTWCARLTLLLSLGLASIPLQAQTRGQITGEVTDASGAVLVGAAVTVVNEATGLSR